MDHHHHCDIRTDDGVDDQLLHHPTPHHDAVGRGSTCKNHRLNYFESESPDAGHINHRRIVIIMMIIFCMVIILLMMMRLLFSIVPTSLSPKVMMSFDLPEEDDDDVFSISSDSDLFSLSSFLFYSVHHDVCERQRDV